MEIGLLFALVVGSAVVWHLLQPRFWIACAGSAITFAVALGLLSIAAMGRLDPGFLYAFAINLVLGFLVAMLIGALITFVRRLINR